MSTAVVFVHGLEGDKCKTWGLNDGCTDNDKISDAIKNTIGEDQYNALSTECGSCEYYSFGYDTSFRNTLKAKEKAEKLKEFLDGLTEENIIFVCHSLGGLIVKELVALSKENKHEINKTIKGIVFYGTPHKGGFHAIYTFRFAILFIVLVGISKIIFPFVHLFIALFGSLFIFFVILLINKIPIPFIIYLFRYYYLKRLDERFNNQISKTAKLIYRYEGNAMLGGFLHLVTKYAATSFNKKPNEKDLKSVDGKNHTEMVKFFGENNENLLKNVLIPDIKAIINYYNCDKSFYEALPLYANSEGDTIIGRDKDINEIKQELEQNKRVAVVASGGYGKTAVIKVIIKDIDFVKKFNNKFAWSFYGQGIEEDDAAKGLNDFAKGLDACWETKLAKFDEQSMFKDIAGKLDDDEKYLLVLDGIEVFYKAKDMKWNANFKTLLQNFTKDNIYILISSREELPRDSSINNCQLEKLKTETVLGTLHTKTNGQVTLNSNAIIKAQLDIPLMLELFLNSLPDKNINYKTIQEKISNIQIPSNEQDTDGRTIQSSIIGTYLNLSEGFLSEDETKNSYMLLSLFDRKVNNKIYKDVIQQLQNDDVGNPFFNDLSDSKIKQNINNTGFSSLSENNFFEIHPILQAYYRNELSEAYQRKYHNAIAKVFEENNDYFLSAYHYLKAEKYQEAANILYEHLGKDAKTREAHGRMRYLHTLFSQIDISKIKTDSEHKIKFATVQAYLYMTNGYTHDGFNKTKKNYDAFSEDKGINKNSIEWIDFLIHFAELANYSGNAGDEDYENAISVAEKEATPLETIKDNIKNINDLEKIFWDFLLRARINESRRYIKDDYVEQKKLYETFKEIANKFKSLNFDTFYDNIVNKGEKKKKEYNDLGIETKHLYHKMSHNIWQERSIAHFLNKEIDKKISGEEIDNELVNCLHEDTKELLKIYEYKHMPRKNYIPLACENLAKIDYLQNRDHSERIEQAIKKAVETNKNDFILQTRITNAYLDFCKKLPTDDNIKNYVKNDIIEFRKFHELQFKHLDFDVYILAILLDIKIENNILSCESLQQLLASCKYKFRCSRIKTTIQNPDTSIETMCSRQSQPLQCD